MITATEALHFSGETAREKVEKLSSTIEKLAKENKRCLRTGWDYEEDKDLWIAGGYMESKEWKEAKTILKSYGYKVSFYNDMYTLIEW